MNGKRSPHICASVPFSKECKGCVKVSEILRLLSHAEVECRPAALVELALGYAMAKKFMVAFGGRAKIFSSKRDYLKWAVSTRNGWKHLMLLPLIALVWLRNRRSLRKCVRVECARVDELNLCPELRTQI